MRVRGAFERYALVKRGVIRPSRTSIMVWRNAARVTLSDPMMSR